jgi:hypothetical protein
MEQQHQVFQKQLTYQPEKQKLMRMDQNYILQD